MQNKLVSLLFSTRLMAILFIVFATAMAVGTFLEDSYGTTAARIWIYNAWWFEAIMGIFVINFCGNIVRYRLHKREKWPTLILHLAFILIIVGAFITRYISYEGIMPIREGETTSEFLSEKTYLTIFMDGEINGEPRRRVLSRPLELAAATSNDFTIDTDYNQQPVTISYDNYIEGAKMGLVESEDGENYLKIVEAGGGSRHDHYLKEGEVSNIHNILIAFNKPTDGAINITYKDEEYFIKSPFEGNYMRMADQMRGTVIKDSVQPLMLRSLYQTAGMQFVIPDPVIQGKYDVVPIEEKQKGQEDALIVNVTTNGETKQVKMLGGKGFANDMQQITIGDLDFYMTYGSKRLKLPFALKLNDFIAEKYPGTERGYRSYMSKVDVISDGKTEPYDIYMNHVLDHKGYRFFQASFDQDEKGTILSVNHDFWGTWITYIGYFLLYLGLMLILFINGSRFRDLEGMLDKVKAKKKSLMTIALLLSIGVGYAQTNEETATHDHSTHAQEGATHEHSTAVTQEATTTTQEHTSSHIPQAPTEAQIDSIIKKYTVAPEHAEKFGSLVIQDESGRMKPVNTFASELLRKLSKSDKYKGLNADQVMLSILQNPIMWYYVPIIELNRKNDSIRTVLGVPKSVRHVALVDLFNEDQTYKLEPYLDDATRTTTPNSFQKDYIKTNERVYLLDQAISGDILRVFPVPEDANNKWVSPPRLSEVKFTGMDSVYTRQILPIYRQALIEGIQTGDYSKADQYLESMKSFQKKFGSEVLPSDKKIEGELFLNKYDVFRSLYKYYAVIGLLMIFFVIIRILKDSKIMKGLTIGGTGIIILLFAVHTAGLIIRWYVSGHAPWSDAYESMIYVAWAAMAIGLIFARRSNLTMAATTFVAAMILYFAHENWTDPAIANLQPVLDSYWLMIHVAVIVGSYGPFFIGAILGIIALLLMIMTTAKNKKRVSLAIQEITIVNEMALTVGLVMLTIGNFLGGQWANESWGRYWGWDPKETWALISIMVYAFVIHMRLVPGLRGKWTFNFSSIVAVYSVLMTYFGVNFYLKGLHSYASGDKVVTPTAIYYSVTFLLVLGIISFWRYKKHYKK